MKTLVLGLGNLLLADEGVGVHVAQQLMGRIQDDAVCVLDAGTAILDVLPHLETADRVMVIDACKGGSKPGTIYLLTLDECVDKPFLGSLHGFDLKRVLALTRRVTNPQMAVIGIEPAAITWSLELTKEVAAVVPRVIEIVEKWVEEGVLSGRPQ